MVHLNLRELVVSLDRDEDVHLARILVLLAAYKQAEGPAIRGITKLAKLDFLLRYPSALRRALEARGVSSGKIPVDDYESLTVEARMIRYRYGPWDHRYRRFLNILSAKGLITIRAGKKTVTLDLTEQGERVATALAEGPAFSRVRVRAGLLKTHLDLGATRLMEFVYEHFPELESLEYNEGIDFVEAPK